MFLELIDEILDIKHLIHILVERMLRELQ